MPGIWRPIFYTGAGGAGVAGGIIAYLSNSYPVYDNTSDELPAGIKRALPNDTHPTWRYCEAVIPAKTSIQQTRPMESFIRQFYDIWTLKIEEAIARKVGYREKFFPPPYEERQIKRTHCGGMFPELGRDDTTCLVFFGPGGAIPAMADLQGFEAAPDGKGQLRLRFYTGNVDIPGAQTDTGFMGWVHIMYLRYLLDAVQRKMKNEKEGVLPKER